MIYTLMRCYLNSTTSADEHFVSHNTVTIFSVTKMKMILPPLLIFAVILQGVMNVLGHENLCPPPRVFPNAEVRWSDRTLGAYATYSCQEGYTMNGPAESVVRYCDENGRWRSSITPECIITRCQPPVVPAYGNVTYLTGSGEYGSVIFYQCDRYYKRVGPTSAQCLSDGTWSKSAPICQIRCKAPILPNGTVSHLNDHVCLEYSGLVDDRLDWRTAQARCQDDMGSLVIISEEEAQETISTTLLDIIDVDGMDRFWIGAEERQSSVLQVTRNWQWVDGTLVNDVFWGPDEPTSTIDSPSRGGCVDLDSATGYEWNDNNCSLAQRYICQFGESGLCDDPGQPLDGSRTLLACDQDDGQGYGQFVAGCLITFQCEPGFRLVGESSSTCESNGKWSNELPTCERRLCSTPPPSDNLAKTLSNSYRGVAVYRCPNGSYAVQGDAFTFCRQNGVWSAPNLMCATSSTMSPTPQPFFDPDWTFIGIVGALGILLLIAILIIIILAAVRNKNLNARRKYIRPLPNTASTAGRKRRSMENTYYSIRQPIPSPPAERSGQNVELKQMKRLSDVGENPTAVMQHNLTYDKSDAVLTDNDYLEPIKVPHIEEGRSPPRLSSGEYDNPLSPRSGTYDKVADDVADDDTVEDEDRLLNNYIIILSDDEVNEGEKNVAVAVSEENETVNDKEVDVKDEEEESRATDSMTGGETKPLERTTETTTLPKNGLQVPGLSYSKEGFGSTVEL